MRRPSGWNLTREESTIHLILHAKFSPPLIGEGVWTRKPQNSKLETCMIYNRYHAAVFATTRRSLRFMFSLASTTFLLTAMSIDRYQVRVVPVCRALYLPVTVKCDEKIMTHFITTDTCAGNKNNPYRSSRFSLPSLCCK